MMSAVLCSCAGGAALLYALYRWIVPAVVQHHAGLALIWHDVIVERLLDTLTRSTRPQVRPPFFFYPPRIILPRASPPCNKSHKCLAVNAKQQFDTLKQNQERVLPSRHVVSLQLRSC